MYDGVPRIAPVWVWAVSRFSSRRAKPKSDTLGHSHCGEVSHSSVIRSARPSVARADSWGSVVLVGVEPGTISVSALVAGTGDGGPAISSKMFAGFRSR